MNTARLIFHPENGGDMFPRNVGSQADYKRFYFRECGNTHKYRCEELHFQPVDGGDKVTRNVSHTGYTAL
jgi:hypothetical protein